MHWTLHPTKGLALAALCALGAATFAWISRPFPLAQLLIGPVAGVVIGVFQGRSLRNAPASFRSARTAADVRRAMYRTKAGKSAIWIQYAAAAVLAAVSVASALAETKAPPNNPAIGFAAGYLLLVFVRDVVALPAVRELHAGPKTSATSAGT
jgi:hypothetical protein